MVEDTKVGSGISFTTRSVKNLPSDIAKDAEVGSNSNDGDDETVKRSAFQKSSGLTEYLTFLCFEKNKFPLIVLAFVEALN